VVLALSLFEAPTRHASIGEGKSRRLLANSMQTEIFFKKIIVLADLGLKKENWCFSTSLSTPFQFASTMGETLAGNVKVLSACCFKAW